MSSDICPLCKRHEDHWEHWNECPISTTSPKKFRALGRGVMISHKAWCGRKTCIGQCGDQVTSVESEEIDSLKQQLAEARADAAAMREVLGEIKATFHEGAEWPSDVHVKALSTTAGAQMLEELELLRKVASAARIASMVWHQKAMDNDTRQLTINVTNALDALADRVL